MGDTISQASFSFNGSIRVETRPERITSDSGALLVREAIHKLRIDKWLNNNLVDFRNQDLITHPLSELLRTKLILLCQGWRDNSDADFLRHDAAIRIAVSDRRGDSALQPGPGDQDDVPGKNPPHPEGLASQPTLSRLVADLSDPQNLPVLHNSLMEIAGRNTRAMNHGRRLAHLTIDIDSLPIRVYGHQPGSQYNGHYHHRIYHPLIASVGQGGDLLGGVLRAGNVYTSDNATNFVVRMLDQAEAKMCVKASLRMDAGFPAEDLLKTIEDRRTKYTCRIKKNAVLDRMAEPHLKRPVGRRPHEARMWFHELQYQAQEWSRPRRVVLVVQEKPDELFLHHFWLITNWTADQFDGPALLEHYRKRGSAEAYMGELMDVLEPALSSSPRAKTHYRGKTPKNRAVPVDSFANNEVIMLLNMLAYNIAHCIRCLLEKSTKQGWSLCRVREQVLKSGGRLLLKGRRVYLVLAGSACRHWDGVMRWLEGLHPLEI